MRARDSARAGAARRVARPGGGRSWRVIFHNEDGRPAPLRAHVAGAIPARRDSLTRFRQLIDAALCGFPLAARTLAEVELAVSEAAANIWEHAYENTPGGPIWFEFLVLQDTLSITLQDAGRPFVARKPVRRPNWAQLIEHEADGGFGRYAMQRTMDRVAYARKSGRNVVTMQKRLTFQRSAPPAG